jgi:hypothetical protein
MDKPDLNSLMDKIKKMEKGEKLDLSSGEDLSIGIMNLIAIEEHMFFTANKTGDSKYYDMLDEVRQLRKGLMKKIVKENEGELWCTSKHLLSASMRLMEVGTKYLGKGHKKEAEDFFKKAYGLYSMFWMINLDKKNLSNGTIEQLNNDKVINLINDKNQESKAVSIFEKAGDLVKRILDCCKE